MTESTATGQRGDNAGLWLAGSAGLAVAVLVSSLSDRPIPWSGSLYYSLGWPLLCVVTALISWRLPVRAWRWPMSMAVGQVFAVILTGAGNMAPVALIYAILLSVPQFTVAALVSARRQAAEHAHDAQHETQEKE